MIAIIDYGMGNLRSVQKAFEHVGYPAVVTCDKQELCRAEKLVLPGVGAFADAIKTLRDTGLETVIRDAVAAQIPFLGICIGMQLLFDTSHENGEHKGLGLLPGDIVRLPDTVKVPQIGWNNLELVQKTPLLENLPDDPYVYFVHSYHVSTQQPIVSATTTYGVTFPAAVRHNQLYALQFHPEKSGDTGLAILQNFGGL